MTYWHHWQGSDEEYDTLVFDLGIDKVRPMPSIDWRSTSVQVFDTRKNNWVRVRVGDYVFEDAGEVWVESDGQKRT